MPNPTRHRLGDHIIDLAKPILIAALLVFVGLSCYWGV
jgi:hypothetical protein